MPLVCLPMGRDQLDVAARVVHAGAGVRLDMIADPREIAAATRTVLADGSYRDFDVPAGCWDVAAGSMGVGDVRQRMNIPGNGIFEFTIG